jgi:hypothetical protein
VTALWALGFTYSAMSLYSSYMIIHPFTYNSVWGQLAIFITETSAGLEHWLFALEYFASAERISQKLDLTVYKFNLPDKQKIFWSVSIFYTLLQAVLCATELVLSNRNESGAKRENTLPIVGYVLINSVSVSLLVQAIFVLKNAVKLCFGL